MTATKRPKAAAKKPARPPAKKPARPPTLTWIRAFTFPEHGEPWVGGGTHTFACWKKRFISTDTWGRSPLATYAIGGGKTARRLAAEQDEYREWFDPGPKDTVTHFTGIVPTPDALYAIGERGRVVRLDASASRWTSMHGPHPDVVLWLASMAYDGKRDRIVCWGGLQRAPRDGWDQPKGKHELVIFDCATKTWRVSARGSTEPPNWHANDHDHELVYEAGPDRLVRYAGNQRAVLREDESWESARYDLQTEPAGTKIFRDDGWHATLAVDVERRLIWSCADEPTVIAKTTKPCRMPFRGNDICYDPATRRLFGIDYRHVYTLDLAPLGALVR